MGTFNVGDVVQTVLRLLDENGPMTAASITAESGVEKKILAGTLGRMLKATKRPIGPKRIHVLDWVYDEEGQRKYPRPLFALGDKPDKKKPKRDPHAVAKAYRERQKKRFLGNSVFNLGVGVETMRKRVAGRMGSIIAPVQQSDI